jgi:hypothetical protein
MLLISEFERIRRAIFVFLIITWAHRLLRSCDFYGGLHCHGSHTVRQLNAYFLPAAMATVSVHAVDRSDAGSQPSLAHPEISAVGTEQKDPKEEEAGQPARKKQRVSGGAPGAAVDLSQAVDQSESGPSVDYSRVPAAGPAPFSDRSAVTFIRKFLGSDPPKVVAEYLYDPFEQRIIHVFMRYEVARFTWRDFHNYGRFSPARLHGLQRARRTDQQCTPP